VICALFTHPVFAGQKSQAVAGERLLTDSTEIAVGEVVGQKSEWTEDHRMILTRYTLRVEKSIKGAAGTTLEITEYGGVVENDATYVSHAVSYVPGRKYLVFAKADSLGRLRTFGGPNGSLPVFVEKDGRSVVRLYSSHPLAALLRERSTLWDLDALTVRLRALMSDRGIQDK